jgi:hypothetical protein
MSRANRRPSAAAVLLVLAMGPAAFAAKPDVTIKFDDGTAKITEVDPQVKGLCFSPDPKKGNCDNLVIWRVTDRLGYYKIQVEPQKGQPACFPNVTFPIVIDTKGPSGQKNSGAADSAACPRGTTWKYELKVIDASGNTVDTLDPFVVFDH